MLKAREICLTEWSAQQPMIGSDKMPKKVCPAQLAANPSYVYNLINLLSNIRKNKGRNKVVKPNWHKAITT